MSRRHRRGRRPPLRQDHSRHRCSPTPRSAARASTLSPSVTATSRMLSPNRASFSRRTAVAPSAARCQAAMRLTTAESETCPTTVLRGTPSRVWILADSRSPCAAWLRFMSSMSISAHGSDTLAWVCRCNSGVRRATQAGDPHLRGRERVHPREDTDAVRVGVRIQRGPVDGFGVGEHQLPLHRQRQATRPVELIDDLPRLAFFLLQRLAGGRDLVAADRAVPVGRCHEASSVRNVIECLAVRVLVARRNRTSA